jgi:lysophospholipase L1-like esterase
MTDAGPVAGDRYVALGDSYTSGEGVEPGHAWPNLLTTHLQQDGVVIELVANPSVTGWTTRHVIEHELPIFEDSRPTFATLLIGVNDWVQGTSPDEFGRRLARILDRIQVTLPDQRKVILITIPDFSMAPEGSKYGNGRDIAQGITIFNDIVKAEAGLRSLRVVDIYPLSQRLEGQEFFAPDNLHPSAAAYERWEQLIYPAAMSILG